MGCSQLSGCLSLFSVSLPQGNCHRHTTTSFTPFPILLTLSVRPSHPRKEPGRKQSPQGHTPSLCRRLPSHQSACFCLYHSVYSLTGSQKQVMTVCIFQGLNSFNVSVSQPADRSVPSPPLQTSTSVRTQTLAVRSASTTRGILSVNAMKVMRWTLSLRPARQKVGQNAQG